jgi:release factor glutamine methyltransferase
MRLQEVLDKTIQFFREKKIESPRLDAELLLAKALGLRRIDLYLKFDQPLRDGELERCREFVRRRSQGEPVAYIVGEKDFYGFSFAVDSRVLIPRPETEILVEAALDVLKKREAAMILDLGCGSGCLGLSILAKSSAKGILVDFSEGALQVARSNAERLNLLDRAEFLRGDASTDLVADREFDVIVANPPYIAETDPRVQDTVVKYEPHEALFAADDGFSAIQAWAIMAAPRLKQGGWMGFEIGIDQGARAKALFESLGLSDVRLISDLSGIPRHVVGLKGIRHG